MITQMTCHGLGTLGLVFTSTPVNENWFESPFTIHISDMSNYEFFRSKSGCWRVGFCFQSLCRLAVDCQLEVNHILWDVCAVNTFSIIRILVTSEAPRAILYFIKIMKGLIPSNKMKYFELPFFKYVWVIYGLSKVWSFWKVNVYCRNILVKYLGSENKKFMGWILQLWQRQPTRAQMAHVCSLHERHMHKLNVFNSHFWIKWPLLHHCPRTENVRIAC